MKAIAGPLVSLLLFVVPVSAQQPLEGRQHAIYIGGGDLGGTSINGLAVGWSLKRDHLDVTIAAHLANSGGAGGYAGGTAYLTRRIGPLSQSKDEVAKKEFELPEGYNGMFTLFEKLNLPAGEYWLVFEDPHNGKFSYANWLVSVPFTISTNKGTRYLGTTSSVNPGDSSAYMPATLLRDAEHGYGYQFDVVGEPVPLLKDEDPSRVTLR